MLRNRKQLTRLMMMLPVGTGFLLGAFSLANRETVSHASAGGTIDGAGVQPEIVGEPIAEFREWLALRTPEATSRSHAPLMKDLALAQRRQARMRDLMIHDPARALAESLSHAEWRGLPEEIRPYVEEPFSGRADVDVYIGCLPDHARIERFTTLSDGTTFRTTVSGGGGRFNRTRKGIQVEGIRMGDVGVLRDEAALALQEAVDAQVPAIGLAYEQASTPRDMYVILVDFSDLPGQPIDPVLLENRINLLVSPQIADMSHYRSHIVATVNPTTYRMPNGTAFYTSNHLPMYDDAVAAVELDGVDLSPYETICVYFARIPAITFAGYASIGGEKMWLNGDSSGYTITHELGHNYGAYHAHSWDVDSANPVDPIGVHTEYGDPTDIMGTGQIPSGHFHVQNKVNVGWLEPTSVTQVTESGTYRIFRTDHPLTDPVAAHCRGLKIEKEPGHYYWLGYRQLYSQYEEFGRGLYVLWQKPNNDNFPKSHLVDMTPGSAAGTADKFDGGLALGKTYSDTDAGIYITPVTRGGYTPNEYMDVAIQIGSFPGNNAPTATLSGPTSGLAMESLRFSIAATDADSDALAYSWDFGDGLIKANSAEISHAFPGIGTYTVRCTVSDMKGGTVTEEMAVEISHPLENWPQQNTIFATNLFDITEGNGILVTVGLSGFVATSTDGLEWTTGNVGGAYANVYLNSVVFDGTQFIAVGTDYDWNLNAWVGVVYSSADGTSWTRRYISPVPGTALNDVAFGNGTLIAVGESSIALRSTDGLNWDVLSPVIPGYYKGVSYDDGVFAVVGYSSVTGSIVMTTFNGFSWSDKSAGAPTSGLAFYELENCNSLLLASGTLLGIWRSENRGYNFSISNSGPYQITGFAYGNGVYFAAGNYNSAGTADVNLVSVDGINWTELPTAAQNDRNAAIFFNNRFITVGQGGSVWMSDPVSQANSGWGTWYTANLAALGLNRDPEDDGDGDGALNFVEYAVGTDAADPSSVPITRSSVDASGYLHITIDRTRAAPDLDYIIERASTLDDPGAWDSIETVPVSETDTELVVRSSTPMSTLSPQFLRLRVRFAELAP